MENQNNFLEDRRRHRRTDIDLPLQYKNLRNVTEIPAGSLAKNLSEGGVCFKANKFISLACRLVLEIPLPGAMKPIKAISKVAWIRRTPNDGQYELGNQFLEITKEDKAQVVNFINNASNSDSPGTI